MQRIDLDWEPLLRRLVVKLHELRRDLVPPNKTEPECLLSRHLVVILVSGDPALLQLLDNGGTYPELYYLGGEGGRYAALGSDRIQVDSRL